jgi:hypothetical protein
LYRAKILEFTCLTEKKKHMSSNYNGLLLALLVVMLSSADAFTSRCLPRPQSRLFADGDAIDREVVKAKELLAKAKAQLKAMDDAAEAAPVEIEAAKVPFFAALNDGDGGAQMKRDAKRNIVMKSKNDDGLITVNGDEMAKLSEEEGWSVRPLDEVFQNELDEEADVYSKMSQYFGKRDVVASIWNLRKTMQTDDFQRIFDKRNRFIGEDV